jgi:hypothetical protein
LFLTAPALPVLSYRQDESAHVREEAMRILFCCTEEGKAFHTLQEESEGGYSYMQT